MSFSTLSKNLRLAIIGHRGTPSSYGGFETFAEEIGTCLVKLGIVVTSYCRSNYFKEKPQTYKGIKLTYLPTITRQSLDTIVHTFLSVIHVLIHNTADVVMVVNVGNAPWALLAKLCGKKVIFCVDGLDWERKKWGVMARTYLKLCSYLAPYVANEVVTDAGSVQEFYRRERGLETTMIPYGTEIDYKELNTQELTNLHLSPKNYFIYVARFEPENNPLKVVESYVRSGSTLPLVMIGDNRYNPTLVEQIKKAANKNVHFLGYVFGERYKTLLKGALAYVRAAEVGGASPAIIEAMGRNVCVIANDKVENREFLADTGLFFSLKDSSLEKIFREVSLNPTQAIQCGQRSGQRAALLYSWDKIGHEYLKLIKKTPLSSKEDNKESMPSFSHSTISLTPKRILMTGAGGMLGSAMYEHFSTGYTVKATDIDLNQKWLSYLDVRDQASYEKTVQEFKPDYIFHLAALTSLEDCERNTNQAYLTNALATKNAAELARRYNAKLVYISSAGVFDGQKEYYEDADEPSPLNTYGLTKQLGALMTEFYAPENIILRPGWMMGGGPSKDKKFVSHIVRQILSGATTIYAVTDKLGTPTYTRDLAKTLDVLLQKKSQGIYNTVCSGMTNRYEIALEIVKILGYEKKITVVPVTSEHFAQTFFANRPRSENLVNTRLNQEGITTMRPWKVALKEYLTLDFSHAFASDATSNRMSDFGLSKEMQTAAI